jgi:hypothetical protein
MTEIFHFTKLSQLPSELMKLQVGEITHSWNVKLKCQVDEGESWWNVKLMKGKVDEMASW